MKILFVLLLALGCYANPTGSELKKTPSTAFDFTLQSPQNKIQETLSDMILIEISKQTFLERRQENLWQCQTDQFGTTYCPSGLATARPYTSYYQSTSYERESTVKDYQNGSAVSSAGSVVDYTDKGEMTLQTRWYGQEIYAKNGRNGTYQWVRSGTYGYIQSIRNFDDGWKDVSELSHSGNALYAAGGCDESQCYPDSHYATNYIDMRVYNGSLQTRWYGQEIYAKNGRNGTYQWVRSGTYSYIQSIRNFDDGWKDVSELSHSGNALYAAGGCDESQCYPDSHYATNYIDFRIISSCPSGYTDNGSNCKKTVNYAFYNYTCPSGYTVANSGLTSCPKTDPNITANNTSTLDDACNSATPPTGNCSKSISYKYYEYLCQAKNSFLEPIKNLNSGLKSPCAKSDPNNTIDNTGTLDDACNSSTPPVNNCQSTEYTCDSTLFKPVYVNGKWQCSPFMCDGKMKCGYGTCDLPTTPSATKYQDVAYNPLQYITNNQCNGDICDYVLNAKVSYCESQQCPKGDDIIEKNGKCYKLECPAGTYLSGEKCIKVN